MKWYNYLSECLYGYYDHLTTMLMAWIAATIRYVHYRREIIAGTLPKDKIHMASPMDWFLFGLMAMITALTTLAVVEYMGFPYSFPFAIVIFWVSYSTDTIYQFIPMYIKKKLKKELDE